MNVVVPALITVREILKIEGDIAHLQIAAPPKLMGDVDGAERLARRALDLLA